MKRTFKVNFTLMKGHEYFAGDPLKMLQLLHAVVDKMEHTSPPGFSPPSRDIEHVPWDRTMIATLRSALHCWLNAHQRDHMIMIEEYEMVDALQKYGLECGNKSTFWWKQYCCDYLVTNFENRGVEWPIQIKLGEHREESGTNVCKIHNCYRLQPVVMLDKLNAWV